MTFTHQIECPLQCPQHLRINPRADFSGSQNLTQVYLFNWVFKSVAVGAKQSQLSRGVAAAEGQKRHSTSMAGAERKDAVVHLYKDYVSN